MTEERLPMADGGPEASKPADHAHPGDVSRDVPPQPVRVETSSAQMVGTLAVAGALAGLAIVLVFQWANPRIEAWRAEVLSAAVTEVLAGAARYETVFLAPDGSSLTTGGRVAGGGSAGGEALAAEGSSGTLGSSAVAEADTAEMDRVYVGYDDANRPVGIAMVGAAAGFQDVIRVIFGYDPASGHVIGMQVLESKETPGLGDKIHHDSAFIGEFDDVASPLVGIRPGRETGAEGEVTMITGATISSETVVDIINARLDEVGARMDAVWSAATLTGGAGERGSPASPEEAARVGGASPTPPTGSGGGAP